MLTSYCAPPELAALLRRHEGVRASPYRDVEGNLTIGVGHNLDCVPLSARAIDLILDDDIQAVAQQVAGVVGDIVWATLGLVRQAALIDMGFMGPAKLVRFERMLAALRIAQWDKAADEALDSDWAREVGGRAVTVAAMLRSGTWPEGMA
jgi:lysozyme